MALKIWLNGSMKKITRHQMVTFVSGTKKKLTKGITFINGEKKILWQTGQFVFNSWTISNLQYPSTTTVQSRIYGIESDESKVVYCVDKYISRANVSNISIPVAESTVANGAITRHRPETTTGISSFDANVFTAGANPVLTLNQIDVNQETMEILPTAITSSTSSSTIYSNNTYYDNTFYVNGNIGICRIQSANGSFKIYKNYTLTNSTLVATISATGYSSNIQPKVYCWALYDNRYVLLSAWYQAVSGGSKVFSLKKIDLVDGTVSTLLDNKTNPVTGILVDGTDIIVTVENTMLKMDASGTVSDTYTSLNEIPTIVGKSGNYYYLTTTRVENNRDYMNIEIVEENDWTNSEIQQTNVKMMETLAFPYNSGNGYICFAIKSYIISSSGGNAGSGRGGSINQLSGGGSGITYSDVELRICRIQCY